MMRLKYKTENTRYSVHAKIEAVEIERETESSVWIKRLRSAKASEWHNYHDSWAEAKAHFNYEDTDKDSYITALIKAARQSCESETNRAFIEQTWVLGLETFPAVIEVPFPPLMSITSIIYKDDNAVQTTLAATEYQVDTDSEPGRIAPARFCNWPTVDDKSFLPVKVTYKCGWSTAASVPSEIKQAILLMVGHWFANHESVEISNFVPREVPMAATMLLTHWKVPGIV